MKSYGYLKCGMSSILLLKYVAFKQIRDKKWGLTLIQLDADDNDDYLLSALEMQVLLHSSSFPVSFDDPFCSEA